MSGELISNREYGRRCGVSERAVRKWIERGMPTVEGKINPPLADEWRARYRDSRQKTPLSRENTAMQPSAPPPPAPSADDPDVRHPLLSEAPQQGSLAEVQRDLVSAKVQKADIELQRLRGELIEVAAVESEVGELVLAAKNRLLLIPSKLCDRLAAAKDPVEIANLLEYEIRQALEELSNWGQEVPAAA